MGLSEVRESSPLPGWPFYTEGGGLQAVTYREAQWSIAQSTSNAGWFGCADLRASTATQGEAIDFYRGSWRVCPQEHGTPLPQQQQAVHHHEDLRSETRSRVSRQWSAERTSSATTRRQPPAVAASYAASDAYEVHAHIAQRLPHILDVRSRSRLQCGRRQGMRVVMAQEL